MANIQDIQRGESWLSARTKIQLGAFCCTLGCYAPGDGVGVLITSDRGGYSLPHAAKTN